MGLKLNEEYLGPLGVYVARQDERCGMEVYIVEVTTGSVTTELTCGFSMAKCLESLYKHLNRPEGK